MSGDQLLRMDIFPEEDIVVHGRRIRLSYVTTEETILLDEYKIAQKEKRTIPKNMDRALYDLLTKNFVKRHQKKVTKCFRSAVEVCTSHKETTLCIHEVDHFILFIGDLGSLSGRILEQEKNRSKFVICINIKYLYRFYLKLRSTMIHEMLHKIAILHHGEMVAFEKLKAVNKRLQKDIETTYRDTMKLFHEIPHTSSRYRKWLKDIINKAFVVGITDFQGRVSDAAIGIIAIELGQEDLAIHAAKDERIGVRRFRRGLTSLDRQFFMARMGNPFYEKVKEIMMYILCYVMMPYECVAYAQLSESKKWKKEHPYAKLKNPLPHNVISEFMRNVETECPEIVRTPFLRFYDSFLEIIDAGAIHNDPLDPNIKKQIYDTECIRRARKAHLHLITGFNVIYKEAKAIQPNDL